MKKLLLAVLGLFLAMQVKATDGKPNVNQDTSGLVMSQFAFDPSFSGLTVYVMGASTPTNTAQRLASGAGGLYSISCSSGNASDYAIAVDSAGVASVLSTSQALLSPYVFASTGATACTGAGCGDWQTPYPHRYTLGLIALVNKPNSNLTTCVFSVRPD